eukprot:TRINITY_DN1368_c0_g1_i3.p1 TRINITY_DN1368_c0_g1~~TRINITY_DN1368_c0_g1_i3.p1  ORF type:complete len:110 (-),score=8.22 TRINITY_DN1368_c0_g1_i3:18-347(-)
MAELVPPIYICYTEALSAFCFFSAAVYVWRKSKYENSWILSTFLLSIVPMLFWMLKWGPPFWSTMWFLGGNVLYCVVCFYVNRTIQNIEIKLRKLKSSNAEKNQVINKV